MKLTEELIQTIAKDVREGLSNIDACRVNDINNSTFYEWINQGKAAKNKPRKTERDRLCINFIQALDKAKIKRKQLRLKKLEENNSATGLIFLLKQEYPKEFNKEPVPIPNFQKLEEFMMSEYTQQEIEMIRKAIRSAEMRRQADVKYDENELFGEDDD